MRDEDGRISQDTATPTAPTNQADNLHEHAWVMSDFVIDTLPATYTWNCDCGADSHDGGKTLCEIKHYG